MKELNNKQKVFCREYVKNGSNGTAAYMKAYSKCTEETARRNASKLLTNTDIQNYIKELQDKAESKDIMTTIQKKEFLTKMILKDKRANRSDKLKALDILNKMDGEYITKVEGNLNLSYEEKLKEVVDRDEY